MDLKLFNCNDSVLLIGEGNFSFALGLEKLNLPIKITASCYECKRVDDLDEVTPIKLNNIEVLEHKGVRVLLGVDGTKLTNHPILRKEKFSKIIFNFPHVGGKMKIHLNRRLLQEFFLSGAELLEPGGQILVSLCKGQGGTAADVPMRRWADTWQIVEMAARANLILTGIEPFHKYLVPNYSSVGYRSRDLAFHTDGALIHIFSKADLHNCNESIDEYFLRLDYHTLRTKFGKIMCPSIYVRKYLCNPEKIENSPIHYVCNKLKVFVANQLKMCKSNIHEQHIEILSDNELPLHIGSPTGSFTCEVNETRTIPCDLRHSLLDVIDFVLPFWSDRPDVTVVATGLIFNPLTSCFSLPPLSNHALLMGNHAHDLCSNFISFMLSTVTNLNYDCSLNQVPLNTEVVNKHVCDGGGTLQIKHLSDIVFEAKESCHKDQIIVGQNYSIMFTRYDIHHGNVSLIYLDKLFSALYQIQNWRQLWAKNISLKEISGVPLLKVPSLYPRSFTFDICFSHQTGFECKTIHNILWEVAGDIITNVELINIFVGPHGCVSKCYRIVYQSFDSAFYREKVVNLHENIIGKVVSLKLGIALK